MGAGRARLEFVDSIAEYTFDRVIKKFDFIVGADDTDNIGNVLDDVFKATFTFNQQLLSAYRVRNIAADAAILSSDIGK